MGLLHYGLRVRDIQTDINDLPQTLSSWDSCMTKEYCKYPVMAGCIVGGIIAISLLICLFRCCMCGYACCSCCCGGCGGTRHKKSTKIVEIHNSPSGPPPPTYNQPPAYREEPQYAYATDSSGKVSADALPAMPTWESTKVEVKEEVEMEYVNNEAHRRQLTPAPGPPQQHHQQEYLGVGQARGQTQSPVHMAAPVPVSPSGQKLGFNPRMATPGLQQYEEREVIRGDYGYDQGPRLGHQPQHQNGYGDPYAGGVGYQNYQNYQDGGYQQQHPHQQGYGQGYQPQHQMMYPDDGLDQGYHYDDRQRNKEWSAV